MQFVTLVIFLISGMILSVNAEIGSHRDSPFIYSRNVSHDHLAVRERVGLPVFLFLGGFIGAALVLGGSALLIFGYPLILSVIIFCSAGLVLMVTCLIASG